MAGRKQEYSEDLIFMTIPNAVKKTGLSRNFFEQGISNKTIPFIKHGKVRYINIPELLRTLNAGG